MSQTTLLQGTLDLLILKALSLGPLHGMGVSRRIEQVTKGAFRVKPGSLFPALDPGITQIGRNRGIRGFQRACSS